jgi:hypothetical protein
VDNATPLELVCTVIAVWGVINSVYAVIMHAQDRRVAVHPPIDSTTGLHIPTSRMARILGTWLVWKWVMILSMNILFFIIAWRAINTPNAPPSDPQRVENATWFFACLVLIEVLLVAVTIGQLVARRWVERTPEE